ncbi:unnamed protein product [Caenorhabditis nigoni]
MSSIFEMPELVMENIIGFLDFRSVLTLRQVCKDLMNFVDKCNDAKLPDSKLMSIDIIVEKDIRMLYNCPNLSCPKFIYLESGNSRSFNGKTTSLGSADILDVAIRDLEFVLKFQKSTLQGFHLHDHQRSNDSKFPSFHVKLGNMFKTMSRKIKTAQLSVTLGSQSEYMSILPFFDSETLSNLVFNTKDDEKLIEIDEIVKTEQWKNAKDVRCHFCASNVKFEDICHFSHFSITTPCISAAELNVLRKAITSCSSFNSSHFSFRHDNETEELSHLWGPAFGLTFSWYFRMKASKERIFRICIERSCTDNSWFWPGNSGIDNEFSYIHFENVEVREVPHGATIQDYNEN